MAPRKHTPAAQATPAVPVEPEVPATEVKADEATDAGTEVKAEESTAPEVPPGVAESDVATLESGTTDQEGTPEESKPEGTPEVKPAFSWDALPEPEVIDYSRGESITPRDLESSTPEPVKARVIASHTVYVETYNKGAASVGENGVPVFADEASEKKAGIAATRAASRRQKMPTEETAGQFLKLAKKYAAFKGWTLRGGIDPRDKTVVAYRVGPRETRTRS